ncbi:autophagy-related protein 27 [Dissophora ornata]|nr:autophagy-related protein 27 [Dissophora ornata]
MSRIHSRLAIVAFAALAALASIAAQGDTPAQYDCGNISVDGNIYDISALKPTTFTITGEPKVEHPSKIRVDYKLNPCQAIVVPDGGENTNCKAGAWVCQETKVIPAEGDPQTIFLRTIAGSAPAADGTPAREVAPSVARAEKLEDVKELPWNLTLKGGNIDGQDQSAVITFICDMAITDDKAGPTLTKYENGIAFFSWKSSVACPKLTQLPVAEEGMGGFSIFLTVLAVFGLVYVVAGAVYKHKVYHATGLDLLPNIDFWRDFPGLVMDVTRHVWESVTGRHTSGHGYVSV